MNKKELAQQNHDWPEQLAVRVARYYYDFGMTQQQIAAELGIGRAKVIRLLAEARERGVVKISIDSPLVENLDLADALITKYKLDNAEVCLDQTGGEQEQLLTRQMGSVGGEYVSRFIDNNMNISVGWGVTLRELVLQLQPRSTTNVSVISLLGSLTKMSSAARFEATTKMAERLNAECHYLAAPIVCDSENTRELLVSQTMFQELRTMALSSDLAVVSIGGLDSGTIRQAGMVNDEEFESVQAAGAIGNFLGYYVGSDGEIVDHPINKRIIGVYGEAFKAVPRRIMISGGKSKVAALRVALTHGWVTDIVTDATTATALLLPD